ncbi:MAG: DNA primase [Acidimicrobiia bacterium]|nr:DNA primase [Acidimicrobiia bacterium]
MGILDEDIARVRDQTDIVALISETVALKRVGQRHSGLCPFHQEKTPSFSVNPDGYYYCFGCQASGDAITFVRETEHLDFVEAVERLAQRSGITLRYDDKSVQKDRSRRSRLVEAVTAAVECYHKLLLESPDGGPARKYLRGRGFDGDAARRFVLGYSPEGWDVLSRQLQQQKFSRDDLVSAGLAFVNKANRLQDQFRGRLMFPIYDTRGEAVGFGGRALGDDGPKYKNSPETPIYQKSRLLYGLNWAKADIVARGEAVICEGYTDVMAYALAGAPNAVATCGTALADDHAKMLKNLARRVVLAYDGDAAGAGAADRWYRWEQELELEVRVADLPAGKDPGDLWRDSPEQLLPSLERAEPFLQFRVDRVLAAADLTTIEGRARAAEAAARMVAEHPSELVRDQYAVQLAGSLDLDADGIRSQVTRAAMEPRREQSRPTRRATGPEPEPDADAPPERVEPLQVDRRELDVLRWAVHEPALVADWLDEALFLDPVARGAYDLLISSEDMHQAIDSAEGPVRHLLERLAGEDPQADDEPTTVRGRLMVNTVEPVAKRMLARMLRDGDDRASTVKIQLDAVAHGREVGDWPRALDAATQLVGWVVAEARENALKVEVKADVVSGTVTEENTRVEQEA